MYIVFLVFVFTMKFAISVIAALSEKKSKGVALTEAKRCKNYYQAIMILWGMAVAVFIMSLIGDISLADIGFRPISFNYSTWFTAITLVLSGIVLAYSLYQLIFSLASKKFREKKKADMSDGKGAADILPRTKKERRLFPLVGLSAGICEEIVYRGFVAVLLQAVFPGIPIFLVVLIPSVLFGIGHIAQGVGGIIATGVLGALWMCLFLVTDSLILPMIVHFIFDLSSTFLLPNEQATTSST